MSRLTETTDIDTVEEMKDLISKANTYDKLSNELGCPLEVVLRALKEGVLDCDKDHIRNVSLIFNRDDKEWYFRLNYSPVSVGYQKVNGYGVAWWLRGQEG